MSHIKVHTRSMSAPLSLISQIYVIRNALRCYAAIYLLSNRNSYFKCIYKFLFCFSTFSCDVELYTKCKVSSKSSAHIFNYNTRVLTRLQFYYCCCCFAVTLQTINFMNCQKESLMYIIMHIPALLSISILLCTYLITK